MTLVRRLVGGALVLALSLAAAPRLSAAEGGLVNLNTATEQELVALPGIGPAKAKAIVEYRSTQPFAKVEDLMNVRGIGQHTLDSLRGKVTVGPAPAEGARR
jgi:competence protein ComEA